MSNTPNDFDFDDDIFGNGHNGDDDTPDEFDFGDGPELPLEDDLPDVMPTGVLPSAADMPVIEVEPEPGGGASRSFIILAAALIFIFAFGLVVLLLLATQGQNTGPSPEELTSTQIVLLNSTVEAQLAATQTQSVEIEALTQTAAAASPTPEPTLTPSPTEPPPTEALPPTDDPTHIAQTQQAAAFAETATALAQPTAVPTLVPTETPLGMPTATPTTDYASIFATQLAFATESAHVDNALMATVEALSTIAANNPQQPVIVTAGPNQDATQAALGDQGQIAATAGAMIDVALENFAQTAAPLQTQLAALTPAAQATSAALSTQVAGLQATQAAVQGEVGNLIATAFAAAPPDPAATIDALATQIASLQGMDPASAQATQAAQIAADQVSANAQIALLEAQVTVLQQALVDLENQLALATAQPASDAQATQVAGLIATQTAGSQQVTDLQNQIAGLQQALIDLGSQLVQATSLPPVNVQETQVANLQATQGALSLDIVNLQATLAAAAPIVQGTLEAAEAQIAAANQQLVQVQALRATQGAQATQASLATRQVLVDQLVSGTLVAMLATDTPSPLDAINQTATALAQAFATPLPTSSLPETTPGFPTAVPTPGVLPQTGMFDEVGGDAFPILAIAVVGLVGVIVVSRALRRKHGSDDDESDGGA